MSTLMTLSRNQRGTKSLRDSSGSPIPETIGSPRYALNLRNRGDLLESTLAPSPCVMTASRPVFTDVRDGCTYIFTLTDRCDLAIGAKCDDSGVWDNATVPLCHLPSAPTDAAPVGDFLVLRLADSSLFYLHYNSETGVYEILGLPPAMPRVEAECCSSTILSGTVPAVKFRSPVADVRTGLPDAIAADVATAVRGTFESLENTALKRGYFTQPIAVRVAVRLWDGSLLWLSNPIVPQGSRWQGMDEVYLPLAGAEGQYTGTGTTIVNRRGWRIKVNVTAPNFHAWRNLINCIEIWTGMQQDLADPGADPDVACNVGHSSANVRVSTPMLDKTMLAKGVITERLQQVAVLPLDDMEGDTIVFRPDHNVFRKDPRTEPLASLSITASSACGHGGYLHLAGTGSMFPAPQLPQGCGNTPCSCEVAVTINRAGSPIVVRSSGTILCDTGCLVPCLWYPSSAATSMTVKVTTPDNEVFCSTYPLTANEGGENGAYYFDKGLQILPLQQCDDDVAMPEATPDRPLPDSVLTSMRGNPFVVRALTENVGGSVALIRAQPIGGGAFTRQYIYAFTDRGIVALTHDISGHHTNMRFISNARVMGSHSVVGADVGLLALTIDGTLLRIADAKVKSIIHGLPDARRLAYDPRHEETWIFPEKYDGAKALVLTSAMDAAQRNPMGTLRSDVPEVLLMSTPMVLFADRVERMWRITRADFATSDTDYEHSMWVSDEIPYRRARGHYVYASLATDHTPVTMTVRGVPGVITSAGIAGSPLEGVNPLHVHPKDMGVLLGRAMVSPGLRGRVRLPVLVPDMTFNPGAAPVGVTIVIEGTLFDFTSANIAPLGNA